MSLSNGASPKKQYAILRYSRIKDMSILRHVSNHNTRRVVSENVRRDAPPPVEHLPDAGPDLTLAARRRMAELGLDASEARGKVLAVETLLTASPEFFERATDAEAEKWRAASIDFLKRKFGPALISVIEHLDEKTPHLQAVSLAAVEKKKGFRGRPPKDPEKLRAHRERIAAAPVEWRFSYHDLLGGPAARLSQEQDDYHACVEHLGLARGETQKEVTDLVLDNGVVVAAARISRGKRKDGTDKPARHFTTQEYQAETRRDRARTAEKQREADAALQRAVEHERSAAEVRAAAEADRVAAREEREGAEAAGRELDEDRRALDAELVEAARANAERIAGLDSREREIVIREDGLDQREREIAEKALQAAEAHAAAQKVQAAADRAKLELEAALSAAVEIRARAASQAKKKLEEADADRLAAADAWKVIKAERDSLAAERARHQAELALLARATDDREGLHLQLDGSFVKMDERHMSGEERRTWARSWPDPMRRMAIQLARALHRVRELTRELLDRKEELARREDAFLAEKRRAEDDHRARLQAERREHEARAADLEQRASALRQKELRAAQLAEAGERKKLVAAEMQAAATANFQQYQRWASLIAWVDDFPDLIALSDRGTVQIPERLLVNWPPDMVATVREQPPAWASTIITKRLSLEALTVKAAQHERDAAYAAERLREMLRTAGPAFSQPQRDLADQVEKVVKRYGPTPLDVERDGGIT